MEVYNPNWISLIQSNIFTRIKMDFSQDIKDELGMTGSNFSTEDNQNKKALFPFVYIWFMPSNSKDTDLERKIIESIDFSIQIEVFDNKKQSRAKKVANEVMRIMTELSFPPQPIPYFDNQGDTIRMVSRYTRTMDWNDIL